VKKEKRKRFFLALGRGKTKKREEIRPARRGAQVRGKQRPLTEGILSDAGQR
jgi:hypothetical protein